MGELGQHRKKHKKFSRVSYSDLFGGEDEEWRGCVGLSRLMVCATGTEKELGGLRKFRSRLKKIKADERLRRVLARYDADEAKRVGMSRVGMLFLSKLANERRYNEEDVWVDNIKDGVVSKQWEEMYCSKNEDDMSLDDVLSVCMDVHLEDEDMSCMDGLESPSRKVFEELMKKYEYNDDELRDLAELGKGFRGNIVELNDKGRYSKYGYWSIRADGWPTKTRVDVMMDEIAAYVKANESRVPWQVLFREYIPTQREMNVLMDRLKRESPWIYIMVANETQVTGFWKKWQEGKVKMSLPLGVIRWHSLSQMMFTGKNPYEYYPLFKEMMVRQPDKDGDEHKGEYEAFYRVGIDFNAYCVDNWKAMVNLAFMKRGRPRKEPLNEKKMEKEQEQVELVSEVKPQVKVASKAAALPRKFFVVDQDGLKHEMKQSGKKQKDGYELFYFEMI